MTSDRAQLEVILRGDISQFQRAMRSGAAEVRGFERAVGTSSAGVTSFASTASAGFFAVSAAVTGTVAALAGVTGAAKSAIAAASNLAEQQNKVAVVFGSSAGEILQWAEGSAQAMGIARAEATAAAGTFGNLFTSLGLSKQAAADMSPRIVQLAADLASFNNSSPEEALAALQSGLVGEVEPLRRFGVAINAAAVEAKVLEMGLAATKAEISEADKVTARYQLILENTKNAQGDFARTSDSLANQQRVLKAEIGTLAEKFGTALLPAARDVTSAMVRLLDTHGDKWARDFASGAESAAKAIDGMIIAVEKLNTAVLKLTGTDLPGWLGNIARQLPGVREAMLAAQGFGALSDARENATLAGGRGSGMTDAEAGVVPFSQWSRPPALEPSGKSVLTGRGDITEADFRKTLDDIFSKPVADAGEKLSRAAGGASSSVDKLASQFDAAAENLRAVSEAERILRDAENKAREDSIKAIQAELEARQQATIGYLNSLSQRNVRFAPGVFESIAAAGGLKSPGELGATVDGVDVVVP